MERLGTPEQRRSAQGTRLSAAYPARHYLASPARVSSAWQVWGYRHPCVCRGLARNGMCGSVACMGWGCGSTVLVLGREWGWRPLRSLAVGVRVRGGRSSGHLPSRSAAACFVVVGVGERSRSRSARSAACQSASRRCRERAWSRSPVKSTGRIPVCLELHIPNTT